MRPRLALLLSTLLIIVAVVPWLTYTDHSHWGEVRWIPFVSSPQKVRDWAANVALYVPFGYSYARQGAGGRRLWRAIVYAGLLSTATEVTQVFAHRRFPSTTDIVFNVLGAVAGVRLARRRRDRKVDTALPDGEVAC